MKTKIPFLALLATSVFATTACGNGGFRKVTYASYMSGSATITTISTDVRLTRTLIGSYKFDTSSTSYGSQIKGFNDTWFLTFSYYYDIVTEKNIDEIVALPAEVNVSLSTGYSSTEYAKMVIDTDCGVFESYREAFINESTLEGKLLWHSMESFVHNNGSNLLNRKIELYEPTLMTTSGVNYYDILFRRNSASEIFEISPASSPFFQGVVESHVHVGEKSENIVVNYTCWPY